MMLAALLGFIPDRFRSVAMAAGVGLIAFAAGGVSGYIKGRIDASNKAELARLQAEIAGLQISLNAARTLADMNASFAEKANRESAENTRTIEEIRNEPRANDDACRLSDDDLNRLRAIK